MPAPRKPGMLQMGFGRVCFKAVPQPPPCPPSQPGRLKQIGVSSKLHPQCSHAGDEGGN